MTKYNYQPKTKEELKNLIKKLIKERGNEADLNDIDVSLITDMSWLFYDVQGFKGDISDDLGSLLFRDMESPNLGEFNGNISKWNVSNVKDMRGMFSHTKFKGDISKWDVSKVENMKFMFSRSRFNGDISN